MKKVLVIVVVFTMLISPLKISNPISINKRVLHRQIRLVK